MAVELFTIGHSSHAGAYFVDLLQRHAVTAVADVRSHPYSRFNPQFKKKALARSLRDNGIAYVFLGAGLGARSDNPRCYVEGRVQYSRLVAEPSFRQDLERLRSGMREHRIALMCAEKDPLQCHRTILVCRALRDEVEEIHHVLADGSLESQAELEARLMNEHGLFPDMLTTERDCIERAYDLQAARIAYVNPAMR